MAQALDALPPRCRETVWLRRVFDIPQKVVAEKLGITEKTVEKHLMKGVQLLAESLLGPSDPKPREEGERSRMARPPERDKP